MTRLAQYSIVDLRGLELIDESGDDAADIAKMRMEGPAYTLFDDEGKAVAAGGMVIFRSGVGEAWFRGTKTGVEKHRIACVRAIRMLINHECQRWALRRVQAIVDASRPEWVHLALWLGFRTEGLMRLAGPAGEDYLMLAWLPGAGGGDVGWPRIQRNRLLAGDHSAGREDQREARAATLVARAEPSAANPGRNGTSSARAGLQQRMEEAD